MRFFDEENYLKKLYFKNSNFRKISKNLMLSVNIVKERINEIFSIIKKQIMSLSGFKIYSWYKFFYNGRRVLMFLI